VSARVPCALARGVPERTVDQGGRALIAELDDSSSSMFIVVEVGLSLHSRGLSDWLHGPYWLLHGPCWLLHGPYRLPSIRALIIRLLGWSLPGVSDWLHRPHRLLSIECVLDCKIT
jgi:hypothetical protein